MVAVEGDVKQRIAQAYERLGNLTATARAVGVHRDTVRKYLRETGLYDERPLYAGRVQPVDPVKRPLPAKGEVRRYLCTSAQNNTLVAPRVWDTMNGIAVHYQAELLIGSFTYNKASYGAKSSKRKHGPAASDLRELWYDPELGLEDDFTDHAVQLAPGLVWCGEMNILPTAVRPLSDLENYTGRASSIFPHTKLAMASVPSGKHEPTKFTHTTGTVTKRNYISKKAGQKADFHHVYGGLLVEVTSNGDWFVRQINVDKKGVAYDLDLRFEGDEVTAGHAVQAITWGDIHEAEIDPVSKKLAWGEGGMMDTLKPRYQFMHDLLDFRSRNGHTAKRNLIHDRFQAYIKGHDSVEEEICGSANFLLETSRSGCQTVVVNSNHDAFMMEWLRIGDYRNDPVNAIYFLRAQLHVYESIADTPNRPVNLLRWAIEQIHGEHHNIRFLGEDESFVLQGIEYGMHGHLGPNGSRGSARGYARMGRRINRGHEHSAGILDGVYTAGLTGKNEQGYNKGPSSWSTSHVLTYPNGKRAIITCWNGAWRA